MAPISLPEDEVEVGTLTQVTGWGATKENGNTNKYLQTVNVPIVSNEDCYNAYGGGINATMICAGVEKGNTSNCTKFISRHMSCDVFCRRERCLSR